VARSLGIPAVVGLREAVDLVGEGDRIIVDGFEGEVIVHPSQYEELLYDRRAGRAKAIRRTLQLNRQLGATTPDGHELILRGNLDFADRTDHVSAHGGQGIGLFRTEFLYLSRPVPPTEEEQYEAYATVARAMRPHPVTIRTLDVGGDKEIKFLGEDAKGQGLRAIRFCLANHDLFLTQLRALLRAAREGELRILLPFVTTIHEVREVKKLIAEASRQLAARGTLHEPDVALGIMIEVPAAALAADTFAQEVDFFSVGTNDLMQYTMAVSREATVPEYLTNLLQPGFLRLLQMITRAARAAGISVAMCGEMAGKPRYTPLLIAMGFNELSMSPHSIPLVKEIIRRTSRADALAIYQKMQRMTADEGKDFLDSYMVEHFPDIVMPRFSGAPHYMR
jgi:phosphotransferase system enzyme I (PtsI)